MPIRHGIRGFIICKLHFHRFCTGHFFKHSKNSVSGIHPLQQFKQKKYGRPIKRKSETSLKDNSKTMDKDPKVYMRNIIDNISKILRFSTWEFAREELGKLTIRWDSYTINQVLKTHPPMEKAWLFFNWASNLKGFKHDQFTYTTMLDIFGEAGRISSMKYVFQQMQEKGIKIDAVTYTSLLHWLSKDGDIEGSLKMWEEMKEKGCNPTVVSYTAFMKVLFYNNRPKEAAEIYKQMIESRCPPNCYTYTVLIEHLAGAGKFQAALEILSKMQDTGIQPDKATCNILVQKCSRAGEMAAMTQILEYMKENQLVLRQPIYLEALEALKIAGESNNLLLKVNPHLSFEGIDEETSETNLTATNIHFHTDKSIVLTLLARRNFIAVEHILGQMIYKTTQLNPELITTIIWANCANCRPSGALMAFKYSIKIGIKLERVAYIALIGLSIRTNQFQMLMEIVQEMVKNSINLGTYLVFLLIYKLGCAGMKVSSAKIFDSFPNDQNTVTYTALMNAYIRSGDVDKGLDIYASMRKKGICASSGTYEVLIAGLEKAGRIQEMEIYRKEQKSLPSYGQSQYNVSLEERLCNLLFDKGSNLVIQRIGL
ncbi:tetratricopeptide repeat (TPR)-like superfamily protein [Tasmannia lanceolata]|uniref:tetratricopeptide repeat (TPR)-like superfamily protein n=1 Tax=Tasmannia lanceolata TaxID=3420 RepID=UPI004063C00E